MRRQFGRQLNLTGVYQRYTAILPSVPTLYIVAATESVSSLTVCFSSRSSLFTTRCKRYVGREEGGGGGRGVLGSLCQHINTEPCHAYIYSSNTRA